MKNKLWTRNFTIISIGSMISMLGNAISSFAIGLLVLDYTKSTFKYALYMVFYNLPKIIAPIVAGPCVDRFSRKRVIYILDFLSAAIYLGIFFLISRGIFNYTVLLSLALLLGTVDGIYAVAYDSFYPNLISEGNYSKAYSVASMIYPLAAFMVPVASWAKLQFGTVAPLFLFNSVIFFLAACFVSTIQYDEKHAITNRTKYCASSFWKDSREGLKYIKSEKGLLVITLYFMFNAFAAAASGTVTLPFFKNHPEYFSSIAIDVVTLFTIVTTIGVLGRLAGAIVHYKFRYPTHLKFKIALCVYIAVTVLEATQLFLPIPFMICSFFLIGILSVTSYNIRISATQSYIPDTVRGRFNGTFQMLCTAGNIAGQLIAGGLAEVIPERSIVVCFMAVNLLGVFFIMFQGREHVKKIYNRRIY